MRLARDATLGWKELGVPRGDSRKRIAGYRDRILAEGLLVAVPAPALAGLTFGLAEQLLVLPPWVDETATTRPMTRPLSRPTVPYRNPYNRMSLGPKRLWSADEPSITHSHKCGTHRSAAAKGSISESMGGPPDRGSMIRPFPIGRGVEKEKPRNGL